MAMHPSIQVYFYVDNLKRTILFMKFHDRSTRAEEAGCGTSPASNANPKTTLSKAEYRAFTIKYFER